MIPFEPQMDFATMLIKDIVDERDDFVTFLEKSYLFLCIKDKDSKVTSRVRDALKNIDYRRRFEYLSSVKKDIENRSYYFGTDKDHEDVFNFDESTEQYMVSLRIMVIERIAELLSDTGGFSIN